jgi:hypothetical protein
VGGGVRLKHRRLTNQTRWRHAFAWLKDDDDANEDVIFATAVSMVEAFVEICRVFAKKYIGENYNLNRL